MKSEIIIIIILSLIVIALLTTTIIFATKSKQGGSVVNTTAKQVIIFGLAGQTKVAKNNIIVFSLDPIQNLITTIIPGLTLQSVKPTSGTVKDPNFSCNIQILSNITYLINFTKVSDNPLRYDAQMSNTDPNNPKTLTVSFHEITIDDLQFIYKSLFTGTDLGQITFLQKLKNMYRDQLVYSGTPCTGTSPNPTALFCSNSVLYPYCFDTQTTPGGNIQRDTHGECLYNGQTFTEPAS